MTLYYYFHLCLSSYYTSKCLQWKFTCMKSFPSHTTYCIIRKQGHKLLQLNFSLELLFCRTAFNTTKHTYSRSVRFSDSCLLQELGAWGHHQDLSLHSWCGCTLEAPRALEPTGPLTRQMCPDKELLGLTYKYHVTSSFKHTSAKWVFFYLHHIRYWLQWRSSTMPEQDLHQF